MGSKHKCIELPLSQISATLLLPLGLLTTNITLGLTSTETVPVLFVGMGILLALLRKSLPADWMLLGALGAFCYGIVGLLGPSPTDGLRMCAASLTMIAASQFCSLHGLSRAARISIGVLAALRLISLAFPAFTASFYVWLGLRGAGVYDGGAQILYAEPSYLASAIIALWAMARLEPDIDGYRGFRRIDAVAIAILVMSNSASAALYAVVGALIVLRNRPSVLLAAVTFAVTTAVTLILASNSRVGILFDALSNLSGEAGFSAFARIDPSTATRLGLTAMSVLSAISYPFGRLQLDMTDMFSTALRQDMTGLVSGNSLLVQLLGNLQPNTVPLQWLVYGGLPLFGLLLLLLLIAGHRAWSMRSECFASPLLVAALVAGALVQSVLTSPFLYMCIAAGLVWTGQKKSNSARATIQRAAFAGPNVGVASE